MRSPPTEALNAGAVAENWRLSTRSMHCQLSSVGILSHWASTLFVCSTFAVMQRVARVCPRQLILVRITRQIFIT